MGLFLAGSAMCGLSEDMTAYHLPRHPGERSRRAHADRYDDHRRPHPARTQNAGPFRHRIRFVIGLAVGGFIVDKLAWQWIFYINLPFGVLAALHRFIAEGFLTRERYWERQAG